MDFKTQLPPALAGGFVQRSHRLNPVTLGLMLALIAFANSAYAQNRINPDSSIGAAATSGATPGGAAGNLQTNNGHGGFGAFGGTACVNQALTGLNASGSATCTKLTSSYVDSSIAKTGTDINTTNQVTATHLGAALPVNQGGSGTTSTLGGLMRGGSPMSAAELSGDATTSGSNAVTVTKINGATPGGTCTNQAVTALSSSAVPTCATITSSYVDTSIAKTGADINTSDQVINGSHITNGSITPSGLASTGVTPGSYTTANLTVNAQGQITAASNGVSDTGNNTVTTYSNVSGPTTLAISPSPLNSDQRITMAASATITIPNGSFNGQIMQMKVCQNGTGGFTPTWAVSGGNLNWANQATPTPTVVANKCDLYSLSWDSDNTSWNETGFMPNENL